MTALLPFLLANWRCDGKAAAAVLANRLPALGGQLFPGWGLSTRPVEGFTAFQRLVRRLSAGPDVHKFGGLVDHTLRCQATTPPQQPEYNP